MLSRILFFCSFLCLPKETNQRKGSRSLGPPAAGLPCATQKKPGAAKLARLKADSDSPRAFSDLFCAAWLREMADKKEKKQ